jgi:L-lactate dehydrogenase
LASRDEESKVCLSKPVVLGRKGVEQVLELPLNEEEKKALAKSAKSLREVIEEAEKAEEKK